MPCFVQVLVEAGQAAGVTLRAQGRRPAQTIRCPLPSSLAGMVPDLRDGVAERVNAGGVRARKAVISNATVWDTLKLLPEVSWDHTFHDHVVMPPSLWPCSFPSGMAPRACGTRRAGRVRCRSPGGGIAPRRP